MKITVCIGSSCHLKGSRQVVEQLQRLTEQSGLQNEIELCGAFCMGNCTKGVSVKIDDELFCLKPEDVKSFFEDDVLPRLSRQTNG
jgi:NADH:ubiquinone oxidoreductase subunit E